MDAQCVEEITHIEARQEGYDCHLRVEGRAGAGAPDFLLKPRAGDGPPADGVLELDMVTVDGGGGGTGSAELTLENLENFWGEGGHPLKGVRVHSKTNSEEVRIAAA